MPWELLDGIGAYEVAAGEFLRADPVAHTVALGVLSQGPADAGSGRPLFAVLRRAGAVAGVCWRTPPYGVGVDAVTVAEVSELAALLVSERPDVAGAPSVSGPAAASAALADALAGALGLTARPLLTETLYRLDGVGSLVVDARPVPPGRCRPATADDIAPLLPWLAAFVAEAGTIPPADPYGRIAGSVADGTMFVWDAGGLRSFAGGRPTGVGVARIGPVYTPPGHRGAGIGTALVEGVCRQLFASGITTVTLFADDGNATSTGIYRRMGFRPVLAWREVALVTR